MSPAVKCIFLPSAQSHVIIELTPNNYTIISLITTLYNQVISFRLDTQIGHQLCSERADKRVGSNRLECTENKTKQQTGSNQDNELE